MKSRLFFINEAPVTKLSLMINDVLRIGIVDLAKFIRTDQVFMGLELTRPFRVVGNMGLRGELL